MPNGARLMVDSGPTFKPLPYGLWSVVQAVDDSDVHWQNGIEFQPDNCDPASSTQDNCAAISNSFTKDPTSDCLPTMGNNPVTVYARLNCGPGPGLEQLAQAEARLAAALTNGEARAIEEIFWTGEVDVPAGGVHWPHLAANTAVVSGVGCAAVTLQPAATVVVTGAVDVAEAIGVLEGAMGSCYGGVPTIHVPRSALAGLDALGLVRASGGQLTTLGGSLVAAGAGYTGSGPDGTMPAYPQSWFYATGAIMARRSPLRFTSTFEEAVDRRKNDLVRIAERTYVIGWDCCLFAVQVSLGGMGTGQGNTAAQIVT